MDKAFGNDLSANIKFLESQLSKMIQLGGILAGLITSIPQATFLAGKQELKNVYHYTKISTRTSWKSNRILH